MVITKIEEEKYREKIFDIRLILDMYLNKFKEISNIISNSFKTNIELEKMIQSVTVMSNIIEQNNKRFENQIKPILTQANLINQSNQISNLINPINQSLYLKNFNTIYKEENKEENNKESESKIDND